MGRRLLFTITPTQGKLIIKRVMIARVIAFLGEVNCFKLYNIVYVLQSHFILTFKMSNHVPDVFLNKEELGDKSLGVGSCGIGGGDGGWELGDGGWEFGFVSWGMVDGNGS